MEDGSGPEDDSRGAESRRRGIGLLLQVAVLLTLALIPIGTVAVLQTQRAIDAVRETYLDALRAQTMAAATPEREAIIQALGVVRGLSDAIAVLDPGGIACTDLMQRSAATNPRAIFVGLIEPPGISRCNNDGGEFDFTNSAASQALFADPKGDVRFSASGDVSGRPVVIVSEPVFDPDGVFMGFVSISLPARSVEELQSLYERDGPAVLLFNARGEILSASFTRDVTSVLPADRELVDLLQRDAFEFTTKSQAGERRDYAVVPIAPGRAYALGSRTAVTSMFRDRPVLATTIAFPLAMWLVSMFVALLTIHRLVIRPIHDLGRRMRGFAEGRRILNADALRSAPEEISEIGDTFETMARKIIHDEADLENTLFEREVLLKEVHHRVKNNLQLMSSILNMQARKVQSDEARRSLRDVQERLRSLATIHRVLYQAPELSQVQFDELLAELVGQLVSIAAERMGQSEPELDLARVTLVPDQAAPLAMLTTEIVTNALKYVGEDAEGRRFFRVKLWKEHTGEQEEIFLEVVNSARPGSTADRPAGLGRRLIDVLAQQLPAEVSIDAAPDRYTVRLSFLRAGFKADDGT
jgi:two-component sensor histidine kinase